MATIGPTATPGQWDRRTRWVLWAILLLGVFVRVRQYAACPSYWYDEAYLLLNIFHRSFAGLIGRLDYHVVAPPAYLMTLRALYLLFGGSEWAMRLPSLLASLAGLFVLVPLAKLVVPGRHWVWAVAFAAVSHHALVHSCEVRPYAGDVLVTELIVLSALLWCRTDRTTRSGNNALTALIGLGLFAPWFSLPSPIVLAGVSLALLVEAVRRRERGFWFAGVAFNGVVLISCVLLWVLVSRHFYYPGLQDHWSRGFVDWSSPWAVLSWPIRCLVKIGDYATTGMGVVFVVLGAVGLVVLARRASTSERGTIVPREHLQREHLQRLQGRPLGGLSSPARLDLPIAFALLGPVLAALFAGFLRKYPLDDRLAFFLAPCLWLAATIGLGVVLDQFRGRAVWLGILVVVILIAQDVSRIGKQTISVEGKAAFKEAFAYVHEHREAADRLWICYPEVHEVYFGPDPEILDSRSPASAVSAALRAGRLWVIMPPLEAEFAADLRLGVAAVATKPAVTTDFQDVRVSLYRPIVENSLAAARHRSGIE